MDTQIDARVLPHNINAEGGVLSAMLMDCNCIAFAVDAFTGERTSSSSGASESYLKRMRQLMLTLCLNIWSEKAISKRWVAFHT
jgi:hypothetical protein